MFCLKEKIKKGKMHENEFLKNISNNILNKNMLNLNIRDLEGDLKGNLEVRSRSKPGLYIKFDLTKGLNDF